MDDLVRALWLEGVSRSEVSRICAELDEAMERFRSRLASQVVVEIAELPSGP